MSNKHVQERYQEEQTQSDGRSANQAGGMDLSSGKWWERLGQTLVVVVKDFVHDDGPQWAAAIAYYSLLSAFPLMLAIASIGAFFVDVNWVIDQITRLLGDFVPSGQAQVESIVREAYNARGSVSIISILLLLWTGSRVFGVVTKALNIAYDVDEPYGFFKRLLVEIIMVFTIGLLFILALASRSILNFIWGRFNIFPAAQDILFPVVSELVPGILLLISFYLIYRYVPRRSVDWRTALSGALFATITFLIARPLFVTYIQRFADYNLIYGSIASVIILVFWAWITAVILLFGGEIVSHLQEIFIEGKSPQRVERQHLERSPTHSGS